MHSHEEGSFIGIVLAGGARRAAPLRHALEPAAAAQQLRVLEVAAPDRRVLVDGAARHPPLEGRHRDLSAARGDRARASIADVPTVLIENAPGSGDTPQRGLGRARPHGARARRRYADRALHRHVRGLPGARPAVCRGPRVVAATRRTRASCSPAAGPIRSTAAKQQARAAGVAEQCRLRRSAAGRGDSRLPRRGRRARLAAQQRHEHAAEDLSVPPVGPCHRRHPAR